MLKISTGKIDRTVKTVVYGSEGIGKSTFASRFPDPLFIDTEGGTAQLDVRRIEKPETWEELLADLNEVASTPDICRTLIVDTADWAEQLCVAHVCQKYKQNSIESFGYGKGYTYLAEEWSRFLTACDAIIASGKHVVIVAHAKQRKQELPDEAGAFDRWEMKLSKQVAPLLKEWADLLLFLNYKTFIVRSENNTNHAAGGKRVMFTTHHPCWDAKNRHVYDLIEAEEQAERDVLAEREQALARELAEMRRRKRKLVDPLQYAMSIAAEDLANYVPTFAWEMAPPSKKQLEFLERRGIFSESVTNSGMASMLIDRLQRRMQEGLATPKQIRCLERYGFRQVGTWLFDDASSMISRLADNNWRVPYGMTPALYRP